MPTSPVKPTRLPAPLADLRNYHYDFDAPVTPQQWIFEGFLEESDFAVWIGQKKHRKTNLCMLLVLCAAIGRDFLWFKFVGKPRKVVYLDFESKRHGLGNRFKRIIEAMKLTPAEIQLFRENVTIIEVRETSVRKERTLKFPGGRESASGTQAALEYWENFVAAHPADIYILDPLRVFHDGNEQDSGFEEAMGRIRRTFNGKGIIALHHMRKESAGTSHEPIRLADDMRAWSDGARGTSAITAHTDLIICQEWQKDGSGDEIIWFGAFMKDAADVEPTQLEETGYQSFLWRLKSAIPNHLYTTVSKIKEGSGYKSQGDVVKHLVRRGMAESTAFRHVKDLMGRGLLFRAASGVLMLRTPEERVRAAVQKTTFKGGICDEPLIP